jgi:hypothetical protein
MPRQAVAFLHSCNDHLYMLANGRSTQEVVTYGLRTWPNVHAYPRMGQAGAMV